MKPPTAIGCMKNIPPFLQKEASASTLMEKNRLASKGGRISNSDRIGRHGNVTTGEDPITEKPGCTGGCWLSRIASTAWQTLKHDRLKHHDAFAERGIEDAGNDIDG
jgi:hypothetical protein